MLVVSPRQSVEIARISDRHGRAALHPLNHGRVAIGIDTRHAGRTTVLLALETDGRVIASRDLTATEPSC